jgi:hypothetical protein
MGGNPFYVQPGGDITPGLAGLSGAIERAGAARDNRALNQSKLDQNERRLDIDSDRADYEGRRIKLQEDAAEKAAKIQALVAEAYQAGDNEKLLQIATQYPEFSDAVKMMLGFKSKATADNYFQTATQFLQDPTREAAEKLVKQRQAFLRQQGVEGEDSKHTDSFLEQFDADPEKAVKDLTATVMSAFPERWKKFKEAEIAPNKGATLGEDGTKKTADQRNFEHYQALKELDPDAAEEFAIQLGIHGDAKTNFEILKLRAQVAEIEDKQAGRMAERQAKQEAKELKRKNLIEGIDSVINEVVLAGTEAGDSWTSTGLPAAISSWIPSSPAYNLKRRTSTIKANLGFDKLQAMRDASPTGGALGQVSERELGYLQDTVTALDPNMGEDRFKAALEKIRNHYVIWRNHISNPGVPPSYKISKDPAERQIYRNWIKELGMSEKEGGKPVSKMTVEELRAVAGINPGS